MRSIVVFIGALVLIIYGYETDNFDCRVAGSLVLAMGICGMLAGWVKENE